MKYRKQITGDLYWLLMPYWTVGYETIVIGILRWVVQVLKEN